MLRFYQDIGISVKTGRVLLAPDRDHLTWLNGWSPEGLDIKLTLWPEKPVATGLRFIAPSGKPVLPPVADGHPFPTAQRIEPQQVPGFGTGNGILGVLPASSVPAAPPAQAMADAAPAPHQPQPVVQPQPQAVAPRVVLYDEDPSDPKGKQYVGSVVGRGEPIKASGNQPADIAVRADIEVPDRKFRMTMSFRRNTDMSLSASHTVELAFMLPPDFSGGGVANVPGVLMKSNEQARRHAACGPRRQGHRRLLPRRPVQCGH